MTSTGHQTARQATSSAPVQLLARIGLVAYGVVHLLVAWLAAQVAIGDGGKADKTGALQTVAASSGGAILLWLVTVGLIALVGWQLAEAIWGHRFVSGSRRTRRRAVSAGEAVIFGYLAFSAGKIASSGSAPSDSSQSSLVANLLAEPFGKPLVAAAGLAIVGIAAFVAHRGLTKGFQEDLDLSSASPTVRRATVRLGQVGYLALGVAYGIAGLLVVVAALRAEPSKATGLDVALKTLVAQPYGVALLLVVAAGVAAFGAFCLFDARYRRG
jgi:hypothetical protein